jgi:hypothetical protein
MRRPAFLLLVTILAAPPAHAQTALPDPSRTPGAINPEVREENIRSTICVRGWTHTVRPPWQYTSALKRQQIQEFRYADRRMQDYEEDHLVPLALGGSPTDPRNLWPQPRTVPGGWDSDVKNELEGVLAHLVCTGRVPLAQAQQAIATNWIEAFNRYVVGE